MIYTKLHHHGRMLKLPPQLRNGFTTIELMVVIAILAVLTSLALPSFNLLIQKWRVLQAVEGLKNTLYFARSEAVKRRGEVLIAKIPKNLASNCVSDDTTQDWDCGWVVYIDTNGNGSWNVGEELQRFDAPPNLTVTRSANGANITLDRWGVMQGNNAVGFAIKPASAGISSPLLKAVCTSSGGRIRVINQEDFPCT